MFSDRHLKARTGIVALTFAVAAAPLPAMADAFFFSTGNPDGKMATTSRPGTAETETGDDFVLTQQTSITSATFTGLVPSESSRPTDVVVEIYRVFPNDSDEMCHEYVGHTICGATGHCGAQPISLA
jgi:hypothetical protein